MQHVSLLPLQQHRFFAQALARLGQPATLGPLADAAPLVTIRRFGFSFASRGPIWQNHISADRKTAALARSGLRLVNADRYEPDVYRKAGFRLITTPASVAELELAGGHRALLKRADSKWRNMWRRAQESDIVVSSEPFDQQRHAWLLQEDLAQQRSKRYRALPHAILRAYALCRPKDVIVLTAAHQGVAVAAMLFLQHHPVATYHLGWSNGTGRDLRAHHRLLFDAAETFGNKGFQRLDLGAVDTRNAPGLARFKIGAGAVVRPLGGTWLQVSRP